MTIVKRSGELEAGDRVVGRNEPSAEPDGESTTFPFAVGTLTVRMRTPARRDGRRVGWYIHWQGKIARLTCGDEDYFEVESDD